MMRSIRPINPRCLKRLVERLAWTVDDEPDYTTAEALMARYVDDLVAGRDVGDQEAQLAAYRHQCPEWCDVVTTLEQLVRLESAGALPALDDLWSELRSACRASTATRVEGVQRPGDRVPGVFPLPHDRARRNVRGL